ncbi:hypothetical protein DdX_21034 [Ditylenchus destructor]|uniref:Uncharacterized protein n=1 Tax=Ditylenchus destructor TaxID=166010 RepID=A0AAD4QVM0_9BILA|nr:hypothetical protein DdX_21034 [Ditylenchus destructor]
MNTTCLALCAVIVINFIVPPIAAEYRCPSPYNKRNYHPTPLLPLVGCDINDKNSCRHLDTAAHCLPLEIVEEDPPVMQVLLQALNGCCKLNVQDNVQHSHKRDKAHKRSGVAVAGRR